MSALAPVPSRTLSLEEAVRRHRRAKRAILTELEKSPGQRAREDVLLSYLGDGRDGWSREVLEAMVANLEDLALVQRESTEPSDVLVLTHRGSEVARGVVRVPSIAPLAETTTDDTDKSKTAAPRYQVHWGIVGSIVLAVGYLWGVVFSETRMQGWGFRSYPVSYAPQEVYMQAFQAVISAIRLPMDWLNATPFWMALGVLLGAIVIGGLFGLLSLSARLQAGRSWLRAKLPNLNARGRRVAEGSLAGLGMLMFWPFVLFALMVVIIFLIAPPYFAARAEAERGWKERAYEKWDRTTWTTSDGKTHEGFVHSCSDNECAILDASQHAVVVARERVGDRRGPNEPPISLPTVQLEKKKAD
jgi:hypothetical protein